MKKFSLVEFSVDHPKLIVWLCVIISALLMTQLPKIKIDTDPKNMFTETSDVRIWNAAVDKMFNLYENTIVLGIFAGGFSGVIVQVYNRKMHCEQDIMGSKGLR
ncbi:membrane protein, partial [Candidatus Magnetobacterium bavaricum]